MRVRQRKKEQEKIDEVVKQNRQRAKLSDMLSDIFMGHVQFKEGSSFSVNDAKSSQKKKVIFLMA